MSDFLHLLMLVLMSVFSGLLCDLLWSDPDKEVTGWGENDRGVSYTFGQDIVAKFLHKHDFDLICRAHQVPVVCFCFSYAVLSRISTRQKNVALRKVEPISSFHC